MTRGNNRTAGICDMEPLMTCRYCKNLLRVLLPVTVIYLCLIHLHRSPGPESNETVSIRRPIVSEGTLRHVSDKNPDVVVSRTTTKSERASKDTRGFLKPLPFDYTSLSKNLPLGKDEIDKLFVNVKFEPENALAFNGGPLHYLPGYESPCWRANYSSTRGFYRNSWLSGWKHNPIVPGFLDDIEAEKPRSRLRCLPAIYLIGAAGSGTSDLYQMLIKYSKGRIVMPAGKEPPFWSDERGRAGRSFSDYVDLFDPAAAKIESREPIDGVHLGVTLDGSTFNFNGYKGWLANKGVHQGVVGKAVEPSYTLAQTLKALYPNTKILTILREPAPRLLSQFRSLFNRLNEETFDRQVRSVVPQWKDCIGRRDVLQCSSDFKEPGRTPNIALGGPTQHVYGIVIRESLYYPWIKQWMEVFGREQMRVIRAEDYYSDRARYINDIYSFLGFDAISGEGVHELNGEGIRHDHKASKMLPKTKEYLDDFFAPYNKLLAEYLDDDSFLWNDTR